MGLDETPENQTGILKIYDFLKALPENQNKLPNFWSWVGVQQSLVKNHLFYPSLREGGGVGQ